MTRLQASRRSAARREALRLKVRERLDVFLFQDDQVSPRLQALLKYIVAAFAVQKDPNQTRQSVEAILKRVQAKHLTFEGIPSASVRGIDCHPAQA